MSPDSGSTRATSRATWRSSGCKNAGKNPTRQGWVDGIRKTNGGIYDNAGLTCSPRNFSPENFGKVVTEQLRLVRERQGRQVEGLQQRQAGQGKIVGDPALIKQYESSAGTGVTTTVAPAS